MSSVEAEATPTTENRRRRKREKKSEKRLADSETGQGETMEEAVADDLNEPTMGEKLAVLNPTDDVNEHKDTQEPAPLTKPPSADSVDILLKQALHADDRALLLECLYTQDERVINNSISLLNPSEVIRLLHSLVSMIQSRGAVLACSLPWMKSLIRQHASGIMSQESSFHALNSLNQLIESRVSKFDSALKVSSSIDFLYAGIVEDEEDQNAIIPVIYEDDDDSEEEESEDAMDTDEPASNPGSDSEEADGIID